MELNLRTVLVILGALVMLGILFDGFRRMRRARQEALKLDVKGDFKFPVESFSSELPNGGARVIGERDLDELMEDAQTFRDQLHEFPQMSALEKMEEEDFRHLDDDVKESLQEERIYAGEPDFQHDSYQLAENFSEDATAQNASAENDLSQESMHQESYSEPSIDDEPVSSTTQCKPASDAEKIPASEHLVPKAKPLNLDEHVPLLMDVEELGEEIVPEQQASPYNTAPNNTVGHNASSDNRESQSIELTAHDIPALEASIADLASMLGVEPQADQASVLNQSNAATSTATSNGSAESSGTENVNSAENINNTENINSSDNRSEEDLMAVAAYAPVKKPGPNAECLANRPIPSLVLVTHVVPHDEDGFCGEDILYLVNSCDLRHGEKDIFHRFEKKHGEGYIQFSMANSFNPGTFNPDTLLHERIHGVSLFMSLPGPDNAMDAFEAMTEMAAVIGRSLGGDVHDETHSIMALQTIEHNRQQVRDFVRKQKLMGKK